MTRQSITLVAAAIAALSGSPAVAQTTLTVPGPGQTSSRDANRLDTPVETAHKAVEVIKDLSKGDIKDLRRGPLLIHGNYCGIGGKPGLPPVDALDAACMRHDACTVDNKLPNCRCDEHLQQEATAIAESPAETAELKALAAATAASMAVLICK